MSYLWFLLRFFTFYCFAAFLLATPALAAPERFVLEAGGNYLVVEVLDDDLVHFEYGHGTAPPVTDPIASTPMIAKTDYQGPSSVNSDGSGLIETPELRIQVDPTTLDATLVDRTKNDLVLTTLSPFSLEQTGKGLEATISGELDVYGLGQQFVDVGNPDIDWEGRIREGGEFGNFMEGFNEGANGNTQMPILYAVRGASYDNYALFLDNTWRHRWDFTSDSKWKVEVSDGPLRLYLMTGPDLADLRRDYMELVGHPLVPPKKIFGLWVSEYGYDDWGELDSKLETLLQNDFPLDGFVLDLQWFGGIQPHSDDTQMGSLTWDETKFPNPKQKISDLATEHGVGIMQIEEAYVGRALPEHADLESRGCLAVNCSDGKSAYIDVNPWWGKGGMLDYTNDACGDYWHDTKRVPLISDGVIGHWTDLGEPEMYKRDSCYAGGPHAKIHNMFNFDWLDSINRGYGRSGTQQRPFMMSRSGAAGIQRFGAAMWSADIASRLGSLASHSANQMHMSFSGMDFYGSDIGGFRGNPDGDEDEMYYRWYAYGMLFDIPGRPHTENLCNCEETAPDRIGDLTNNRFNTRLRYELIPYLYSLAHRAYRFGEPVMPPPILYYQTDDRLRNQGDHKMIGRDLLAAVSTSYGETHLDVLLPAGAWYDWHDGGRLASTDGRTDRASLQRNGSYTLPLYAREGAIIPVMHVDAETGNALGKRRDDSERNELMARVFAGPDATDFTLYEDDGVTIAYRQGAVRETRLHQQQTGDEVVITIEPAQGSYDGGPSERNNVIALTASLNGQPATVNKEQAAPTLGGQPLTEHGTMADFEAADNGWYSEDSRHLIWLKSGVLPVAEAKTFAVKLSEDDRICTSDYRTIFVPGEDNGWNPSDATRSLECLDDRIWTGEMKVCGGKFKFAADGSWTRNWGSDGKQDGPNFPGVSQPGLYAVTFDENDAANPVLDLLDGDAGVCGASAEFVCENGYTTWGKSVYVVGNVPVLDNWGTAKGTHLDPNGPYPTWTKRIGGLPPNTDIEWKCIKRLESGGPPEWQPGDNNRFRTPAAGDAGRQVGRF
jgi:alpha-glucosidase